MTDGERLMGLLRAMGCSRDAIATLVIIEGEPWSKMRAQHARRGRHVMTYQPKEDEAAEAATGHQLRRAVDGPLTGNVAVAAIFYQSDRRTHDYDNFLKHVGDSGNKIVWLDDCQITAGAGIVELDADNPRMVIAIAPHVSSMKRGTDNVATCPACGEVFNLEGKPATVRFCGTTCAAKGRRKDFVAVAS